ncbi:hypothetical protein M427DRAFT_54662 [Gonapodya prolifera JEL478]|uniref:Uncharacterized protein n=1 Tax=Gonapodya prolifera (strain JEL478) TaxID=1344416 RepID=A0A139AKT0_GONPJ|nr:hypothetical protein M427DRAFT_54662 [Gonapodya prolifera JEL478]|eukprot:KXS17376.1 hypothetical protein M427DRAFT_54662 [Gonapodya prolifera JEL478]
MAARGKAPDTGKKTVMLGGTELQKAPLSRIEVRTPPLGQVVLNEVPGATTSKHVYNDNDTHLRMIDILQQIKDHLYKKQGIKGPSMPGYKKCDKLLDQVGRAMALVQTDNTFVGRSQKQWEDAVGVAIAGILLMIRRKETVVFDGVTFNPNGDMAPPATDYNVIRNVERCSVKMNITAQKRKKKVVERAENLEKFRQEMSKKRKTEGS